MADWRDDEGLSLLHKAAFDRDPKALRRLLITPRVHKLIYTITAPRGYRKLGLLRHLVRHQRVVVRLLR